MTVTRLAPLDLAVFVGYSAVLFGVGLWFMRRQRDLKSYLLADQDVHWAIVAISILAAFFSGISYLGAPSETYFNDLTYIWVLAAFFVATPITTLVFLPIFRKLNGYTAYEYLERRFDRRLRQIAAGLYIVRMSCQLGMAIYAPALVVLTVTGWDLSSCIVITGLAAAVCTALGGMKAVIWTDTLQFFVLCGGILLIVGCAVARVPGGLAEVWSLAAAHGKTQFVRWDLDPRVRVTIWSALFGGGCIHLVQMVTDQVAVQRYMTATSLRESQRALWAKLAVTIPIIGMFYLTGTVLFGYYQAFPDRVLSPDLPRDQILPQFVVHELPSPFPGLLVAAVIGSTLAVVAAGINSLATSLMIDFRIVDGDSDGRRGVVIARLLTVGFGVLVTLMALGFAQLDSTIVETVGTFHGLFGGPCLGMFFLGVLSRRANGAGVLLGAILGFGAGLLTAFSGRLFDFPISFMWVAFLSALATMIGGELLSRLFPAPSASALALVHGATDDDIHSTPDAKQSLTASTERGEDHDCCRGERTPAPSRAFNGPVSARPGVDAGRDAAR